MCGRSFLASLVLGGVMFGLSTSQFFAQEPAVADPPGATKERPKDVAAATTPAPRDMPWWQDRHASMNKQARATKWDVVFMGDSITQGWEGAGKEVWKKQYGERKAGNLGISGDETEHLAWRLENGNLEGQAPKVAVIMIGTNNLGNVKHSPEAVIAGITLVVETVRKHSPETDILLLGVFPRGEQPDNPFRKQIKQVNEGIAKLAADDQADDQNDKGGKVHFLDIQEAFLEEDGSLSKEVMPDFLHLSPAGYERWAKAIEPALEKLLQGESAGPATEGSATEAGPDAR